MMIPTKIKAPAENHIGNLLVWYWLMLYSFKYSVRNHSVTPINKNKRDEETLKVFGAKPLGSMYNKVETMASTTPKNTNMPNKNL